MEGIDPTGGGVNNLGLNVNAEGSVVHKKEFPVSDNGAIVIDGKALPIDANGNITVKGKTVSAAEILKVPDDFKEAMTKSQARKIDGPVIIVDGKAHPVKAGVDNRAVTIDGKTYDVKGGKVSVELEWAVTGVEKKGDEYTATLTRDTVTSSGEIKKESDEVVLSLPDRPQLAKASNDFLGLARESGFDSWFAVDVVVSHRIKQSIEIIAIFSKAKEALNNMIAIMAHARSQEAVTSAEATMEKAELERNKAIAQVVSGAATALGQAASLAQSFSAVRTSRAKQKTLSKMGEYSDQPAAQRQGLGETLKKPQQRENRLRDLKAKQELNAAEKTELAILKDFGKLDAGQQSAAIQHFDRGGPRGSKALTGMASAEQKHNGEMMATYQAFSSLAQQLGQITTASMDIATVMKIAEQEVIMKLSQHWQSAFGEILQMLRQEVQEMDKAQESSKQSMEDEVKAASQNHRM